MRHLAAYLLLKLGGNDSPSADDITKALGSVGVEVDGASLSKLMGELEGKDLNEILATGKEMLATFGGGGGGGGGAAAGGAAAAEEAPAVSIGVNCVYTYPSSWSQSEFLLFLLLLFIGGGSRRRNGHGWRYGCVRWRRRRRWRLLNVF